MVSSQFFSPGMLLSSDTPHRLSAVARPSSCRSRPSRWPRFSPPASSTKASWADLSGSSNDGVGGWFLPRRRTIEEMKYAGPRLHFVTLGASAAIFWAALTYFCQLKKGFKFCFTIPPNVIQEKLMPLTSEKHPEGDVASSKSNVDQISESKVEEEELNGNALAEPGGRKEVAIPVAPDIIQQEAVSVLIKLKIMEDDVIAEELCTRSEYARWFVKINCLERNPKYKILSKPVIVGPVITFFDDVNPDNPDFWYIQSLAEVGIVLSKLSALTSTSTLDNGVSGQKNFQFLPQSFLSRFDLLNWKALLEYSLPSKFDEECSDLFTVQMLRNEVNILDITTDRDVSPHILVDLMAGDNSITRRTFGNIRRLQPCKPVTKAQAAVVLTSGRMAEAIQHEISRLEAEKMSRLHDEEEIKSELIQKGDIQRFWQGELEKEQDRFLVVEKELKVALLSLENEKKALNDSLIDYVKEKGALSCREKLQKCLKEEVDQMYDNLSSERADLLSEQQNLERYSAELCAKQDAVVEAKSILEAEKEAIRIVRSWVEEEAMQMRSRADVLEQAVLRWRYNSGSGHSQNFSSNSECSD
ncbi:hypothetical protein ZIOFF_063641 [Zingiber officinale]|uniref:SLH domain-containing protein n=1 Tax=Zingiber officinale TaxID=94328 RepID=A0A8J5KKB4_ZINOF|nr:hypothetical protein ZIOFF_063641 [Zingiber officinale]